MRVPDRVIDEIRERTDLIELIGGYVQLKRSGRNHLGLCPFHQEKTPSFNVSPDRNIWHCFGCGETGDCFKFLMEHDHLSFPEAMRALAERAGVDLKPYEKSRGGGSDFDHMYRIHEIAERLYRHVLFEEPDGQAAREEIARRGYTREIVEEYQLGASPSAWERLVKLGEKEGIPGRLIEKSGLALRRDSGGWYDRFRGRLMFSIHAAGSKPIGFGGRALGDDSPKYLNSPESPLFQKRKTLYGIPQATNALREKREAILVEGYTDVLALAMNGFGGALAALGTAFTVEHAAWLKRSCDRVLVLFDGDAAGQKAAESSVGPLLGEGLEVVLVPMPAGEDPDSLLREEGPEKFAHRLEQGLNPIDALLGDEAYEGSAGRERAVRRVLSALVPVKDPLRREVLLQEIANRVGLSTDLLEKMVNDQRQKQLESEKRMAERQRMRERATAEKERREVPSKAPKPAAKVRTGASAGDPGSEALREAPEDFDAPDELEDFGELAEVEMQPGLQGKPSPLEITFLGLVLHDESLGESLLERFDPSTFEYGLTQRIAMKACEIAAAGRPVSAASLIEGMAEDEPARELIGELSVSSEYSVAPERTAQDLVSQLERRALKREMAQVDIELRKAKAQENVERVTELQREKSLLMRRVVQLASASQ